MVAAAGCGRWHPIGGIVVQRTENLRFWPWDKGVSLWFMVDPGHVNYNDTGQ